MATTNDDPSFSTPCSSPDRIDEENIFESNNGIPQTSGAVSDHQNDNMDEDTHDNQSSNLSGTATDNQNNDNDSDMNVDQSSDLSGVTNKNTNEKVKPESEDYKQHIVDNSSVTSSSTQADESRYNPMLSEEKREKNIITSGNSEEIGVDNIEVFVQNNNDENIILPYNQSGLINQQTNQPNTSAVNSNDDRIHITDFKNVAATNTSPPSDNSPITDIECGGYGPPPTLSPNNDIFNEDGTILNGVSPVGSMYSSGQFNKPVLTYTTPEDRTNKSWLNLQCYEVNDRLLTKKPNEIENEMDEPPFEIDNNILSHIQGSIIGMALGDALGAHVEFRPHQFLVAHPVEDLGSGGTWGLEKGQFTDDTSMALCLANSLVACRGYIPYDQLVRYKWWYNYGYMSSTGQCFDIGAATRQSVVEFERRQKELAKEQNINLNDIDSLSDPNILEKFNVFCSEDEVAGNGALMRLTPVPLFFYRYPAAAVELSGLSGKITHGDQKAYDACRYYGALIVAALRGFKKDDILDNEFYSKYKEWFGENELHPDIKSIAEGSYKKDGYNAGIRGKGYIVSALEAALWAFWSDDGSFEKGALAAVNLGDDTDTTAAIYGQLAGAFYGYQKLPEKWLEYVYARKFMEKLSKWIVYEGDCWQKRYEASISKL